MINPKLYHMPYWHRHADKPFVVDINNRYTCYTTEAEARQAIETLTRLFSPSNKP